MTYQELLDAVSKATSEYEDAKEQFWVDFEAVKGQGNQFSPHNLTRMGVLWDAIQAAHAALGQYVHSNQVRHIESRDIWEEQNDTLAKAAWGKTPDQPTDTTDTADSVAEKQE